MTVEMNSEYVAKIRRLTSECDNSAKERALLTEEARAQQAYIANLERPRDYSEQRWLDLYNSSMKKDVSDHRNRKTSETLRSYPLTRRPILQISADLVTDVSKN